MMFTFFNPCRINFGSGKFLDIGKRVSAYGKKCLLVTTDKDEPFLSEIYRRAIYLLEQESISVVHYDGVVPNPTIKGVDEAIQILNSEGCDVILALGGGSSIDTAKAVSIFHHADHEDWHERSRKYDSPFEDYAMPGGGPIPLIAVPTTAGTGSDVTQAMVLSDPDNNSKFCIFHPMAYPKESIIDPGLTLSLPERLTASTGFDAFTHAFESYVKDLSSPVTELYSMEAMRVIVKNLPRAISFPKDEEVRERISLAATYAGIALSNAGAFIPHPLSELVGGYFPRLSHGQCLAAIYPAFLRYQIEVSPEKCRNVASLFGINGDNNDILHEFPIAFEGFLKNLGLSSSFSDLGVTEAEYQFVLEHPMLKHLPMAPSDKLIRIMEESY